MLLACATGCGCRDNDCDNDALASTSSVATSLIQNEIFLRQGNLHQESITHHNRFQENKCPSYKSMEWSGDDHSDQSISETDNPGLANPPVIVHIMGNLHHGTNLLANLIELNVADVSIRRGTMHERLFHGRDASGGPCDFWKHAPLSFLKTHQPETLAACSSLHVKGIAIIRNPLSWFSSLKKRSFDLFGCTNDDDWLSRPCSYPTYEWYTTIGPPYNLDHYYMAGANFSSLADIWNIWTKDYEKVNEFGFEKAMFLHYEDLVMQTDETLSKIAEMLGTSMCGTAKEIHRQVSPMTMPEAADAQSVAMNKITKKTYLNDFTKQQLHDACSRLDQDLMRRHGYDDCKHM